MIGRGWAIRHLLWPLMEFRGNRTRIYLEHMRQTQAMPPQKMRAWQMGQLASLLRHAVEHVPAYKPYREKVLDRLDNPAAALRELPVLTKTHFNRHRDDYLADGVSTDRLIANRTGGSTGEPTRFYLDRVTVEHYEAARWRGLSWHGVRIGDPSVMIWGSNIELTEMQRRKYRLKEKWLKNRLLISAHEWKPADLERHLQAIRAFRPRYLYGYASALHLFAEMMLERGIGLGFPLQAVVSTAEMLHPRQREAMERAFACPVVNEYGARDGGIIAYECPRGHMHLTAENAWYEVVDRQTLEPVAPGEKGLLLVTDLHNFSQPRLRYQLGDIVSISSGDACGEISGSDCGIRLPILETVDGRDVDTFITRNGSVIHPHYFNQLMRNLQGFRQYQVIQHSPDRVTVKFVQNEELYRPEEERIFVDGLRRALGEDVEITVEHVAEIPRSPSGKLRYAVREFDV